MCITGIIMYGTCVFVVSYIFWQYQDIAVEIIYSFSSASEGFEALYAFFYWKIRCDHFV